MLRHFVIVESSEGKLEIFPFNTAEQAQDCFNKYHHYQQKETEFLGGVTVNGVSIAKENQYAGYEPITRPKI